VRVTFADIKNSRVPEAVNIPPTDSRLIQYVNEAQERLLKRGRWWGTTAKYSFYATNGYITLPRQVATVERVAVQNRMFPVRDFWFEWLDNGWGTRDASSGTEEALFRGRYPVFNDIVPGDKKLTVKCDVAGDVGKEILLLGYDDDANWIRTSQDGTVSDGEVVALATGDGTTTTNTFASITDIQAPSTLVGQWWLYEYDTDESTNRLIGQYQYDETRPSYARYWFPSIPSDSTILVEALVKLDFVPLRADSDYLLLGNIPAIKEMCMAIKAREEYRFQDAIILEASAVKLLDDELAHYLGAGRSPAINIQGSSIGLAEPIETLL